MLGRLFRSMRATRAVRLNDAGIRYLHENRVEDAARYFERAIAANPYHAPSCNSLAAALLRLGRSQEGLEYFRRAVALEPENVDFHVNLGEALTTTEQPDHAVDALQEALRRDSAHARAHAFLLRPLLEICAWDDLDREVQLFTHAWERDPAGQWLTMIMPFVSLLVPLPPGLRLEIARRYAASIAQRVAHELPLSRPARAERGKLRVGYASADFYDHATAQLTAGLFEAHDRDRFEVFAYSFGMDDNSACRKRLVAAFDSFVEVAREPARATAQRIADDGIDILIDLKGYTAGCRPEIFALRPAPIQASYLGYPGSTGANFIDYAIADRVVLPKHDWTSFTERPVWMPVCYQANDRHRPIAGRVASRTEYGLPETGFVFCSFNSHNKIERHMFHAWMRILAAVPGSVLWLLRGHGERRLRLAAAAAGVDPDRLRFTAKLPNPEHLARHRLADLFLDTHYVNAHTTASDALWAGLPVLTLPGPTFAGRVAASLLHAVCLPELIVRDISEYTTRAVQLALDSDRLREVRVTLAANRLTTPLFDTAAFTCALEQAYEMMWRTHAVGESPQPIVL